MKKYNKSTKFEFEKFFTGKVKAEGYMTFFYPKPRKERLKAVFTGTFKNNKLKLMEEYFESNSKTLREWEFKKISDYKFKGYEKNIINPFEVIIKKDFLEMSYRFKTKYKATKINVYVKDQMFKVDEYTIINYTKISKFFLPIAESQLLYKKL